MKPIIIRFIKDKIETLENAYAQNYVAKKELEDIESRTPTQNVSLDSAVYNMEKALEKITWYKKLLKTETKNG